MKTEKTMKVKTVVTSGIGCKSFQCDDSNSSPYAVPVYYRHGLRTGGTIYNSATLRQELYNKRLPSRTTDCSSYRKADEIPVFEEFIKNYV